MYRKQNVVYIKVNNLFTYDVDLGKKSKEFWLSHLREKNWWSLHKEVLFNRLTS